MRNVWKRRPLWHHVGMELLGRDWIVIIVVAAIAFYLGRLSTGTSRDRARYEAWEQREADENIARLSSEARAEVRRLVEDGRTIDAVKLCRADLGLDLKSAKAVVDRVRSQPSPEAPRDRTRM